MKLRTPALALLLGLLTASCASRARSPMTQPDPDGAARIEALATIVRAEDRRQLDADLLARLEADDPELRARAMLAIGRIAGPRAREHLRRGLADPAADVRARAVHALGVLGDPVDWPHVTAAASDPDPAVRAAAVDAAAAMPRQDGHDDLITGLLGDDDPTVRARACLAAARRPSSAIDPATLDRLADEAEDAEARFAAVHALARLGAPRPGVDGEVASSVRRAARERLRARVSDRSPVVRMEVARGLTVPMSVADTATLTFLADDRDWRVRVNVARALGYPGGSVGPLSKMLRDGDPRVVRAALESLGKTRSMAAARLVAESMIGEARPWVREQAVLALAQTSPEIAGASAARLARDPDPAVRAAVARSLTGFTGPADRRLLGELVADPSPRVRAAAVGPLAQFVGTLTELLGETANDADPGIRTAVARAAGSKLRLETALPVELEDAAALLRDLWERSREDPAPSVRLAILESAARGGDDPRLRVILDDGTRSPDRATREAAWRWLEEVHGVPMPADLGPATDRPLADYLEIVAWASRPRAAIVTVERPGFLPGRFTVALDTADAPLTSWSFARLAEDGFFEGQEFFRVVPNFIAQTGDPRGDGFGGPGYVVRDEIGPGSFVGGALGMATVGRDTGGSQWFVTHSPQPHLDGRYTRFGRVVQNLAGVVRNIQERDRIVSVKVYEGDGTEPLPPLAAEPAQD